jgi:hypothetical protein
MTKQTKLELVQINARLAAENAALRTQVADLEHNARIANEIVATLSTPTQRVARHMPQWQVDRAAAMHAAREMAMRTRMAVKV